VLSKKKTVRIAALLWIASTILLATQPLFAFERYNRVVKYDRYFAKYSKRYFGPNFDWHYFKAQAIAESRLKPEAQSQVGALGVMQIMPKTFDEIVRKNPTIKGTRDQPRWSIAAGIYYDRKLWSLWKADRPAQDRIDFMFGSYNAGSGNILKAQRIAETGGVNPNLWQSIEPVLPKVTGEHSRETINYIRRIRLIKGVLE